VSTHSKEILRSWRWTVAGVRWHFSWFMEGRFWFSCAVSAQWTGTSHPL